MQLAGQHDKRLPSTNICFTAPFFLIWGSGAEAFAPRCEKAAYHADALL
jgi:hypothetical protein